MNSKRALGGMKKLTALLLVATIVAIPYQGFDTQVVEAHTGYPCHYQTNKMGLVGGDCYCNEVSAYPCWTEAGSTIFAPEGPGHKETENGNTAGHSSVSLSGQGGTLSVDGTAKYRGIAHHQFIIKYCEVHDSHVDGPVTGSQIHDYEGETATCLQSACKPNWNWSQIGGCALTLGLTGGACAAASGGIATAGCIGALLSAGICGFSVVVEFCDEFVDSCDRTIIGEHEMTQCILIEDDCFECQIGQ